MKRRNYKREESIRTMDVIRSLGFNQSGAIIALIIILIIVIGYLLYRRSGSDQQSSSDYSKGSPKLDQETTLTNRDLYQPCPCNPGLICDQDICKVPSGGECVTSSACTSDHLCFLSRCVSKPSTWEEKVQTSYTKGMICVDHHLLTLDQERFNILPGFWVMKGVTSVCDSNINGFVYVVCEDGIYRSSVDNIISGTTKINQSLAVKKLFRHQDLRNQTSVEYSDHRPDGSRDQDPNSSLDLYALAVDGGIYHLNNESFDVTWEWTRLYNFHSRELTHALIDDVYTSPDGKISFLLGTFTVTYSPLTNKWEREIDNPRKISYGELSSTRLVIHQDRIDFIFSIQESGDNEIVFTLRGGFQDGELNQNEDGFLVINHQGDIYEYRPIIWSLASDNRGSSSDCSLNNYQERSIEGSGDLFFRSKGHVWLVTGTNCLAG